jgi:hypothetical protein
LNKGKKEPRYWRESLFDTFGLLLGVLLGDVEAVLLATNLPLLSGIGVGFVIGVFAVFRITKRYRKMEVLEVGQGTLRLLKWITESVLVGNLFGYGIALVLSYSRIGILGIAWMAGYFVVVTTLIRYLREFEYRLNQANSAERPGQSDKESSGSTVIIPPPTIRRTYIVILALAALALIIVAFYSANAAVSLALLASSTGLIFATFRLKSATDNLVSATESMARNQILPRLSRTSTYWDVEHQSLTVQIRNTGTGTAYGMRATAFTPAKVPFIIETDLKLPDLGAGETWSYTLTGIDTRAFREMRVDFEYSDAKGYGYKQTIIIPK